MTAWQVAHIGFEGDNLKINGSEVWTQKWRPVKTERPLLPHPTYPKQMDFYHIYEIGDSANPVRFAAAELSNGVFGFYVPAN